MPNSSELTEDELTCLGICAQGESLAAIGRWEPSVDALVEKGLLVRHDKFNNTITPAGRAALAGETADADEGFRAAISKSINVRNAAWQFDVFAAHTAREMAVNAQALERAAGFSAVVTIHTWIDMLRKQALAVLDQK